MRFPIFRSLVLLLALFFASPALAQTFPTPLTTTVNDFADLLPADLEAQWQAKLTELERKTGIEFAIVTLASKQGFAPNLTEEAFATELFNSWGIGKTGSDNGILLLFLEQERFVRIELGAGYGRAWDRVAQAIVDRVMLPEFRAGRFPDGLAQGADAMLADIAYPFAEGANPVTPPNGTTSDDSWAALLGVIAAAALFAIIRFRTALFTRFKTCSNCGTRGSLRISRRVLAMATRQTGGVTEITRTCQNCGHSETWSQRTSRAGSSTSKSSGGAGFGGGRSGGGGASGRF